jgi:glycosyltransferase involved in cell wall biosynthesis
MKVLHLNEHLAWAGGVETYLLSLLPGLEHRGHPQAVVFARGDGDLVRASHFLPDLSLGTRAAERRAEAAMHAILEEERPDLVHVHSVYNYGAVRACLDRLPVLLHGHDYRYLCPASSFFHRRSRTVCARTAGPGCFTTTIARHCMSPRPRYALDYYRRVKWFARESDRFAGVIAPSEAARERFLAAGFAPGQVTTLPYFCPLEAAAEPRPLPARPLVLFIGRIRPNKGVDIFLDAFTRLPTDVRALMVGDFTADSRQALQQQARALGCADRIELSGWVDRESIRGVFERATVFAFPSLWPETLGIVGIEALACGVPVVASDIGGVREWLRPGETGLLVPPKDPVALAAGLEELLSDLPRNLAMGRSGIALVRERFSQQYHQDRLLERYTASLDAAGAYRAVS